MTLWNVYGVTVDSDFSDLEIAEILQGVAVVAEALLQADPTGGSAGQIFKGVFGQYHVSAAAGYSAGFCGSYEGTGGTACGPGTTYQHFDRTIAHELGHVFQHRVADGLIGGDVNEDNDESDARTPYEQLRNSTITDALGNHVAGLRNGVWQRTNLGYGSAGRPDQMHPLADYQPDPTQPNYDVLAITPNEDYGDMFLNWAYDSFATDTNGAGAARYQWMQGNMRGWMDLIRHGP